MLGLAIQFSSWGLFSFDYASALQCMCMCVCVCADMCLCICEGTVCYIRTGVHSDYKSCCLLNILTVGPPNRMSCNQLTTLSPTKCTILFPDIYITISR